MSGRLTAVQGGVNPGAQTRERTVGTCGGSRLVAKQESGFRSAKRSVLVRSERQLGVS